MTRCRNNRATRVPTERHRSFAAAFAGWCASFDDFVAIVVQHANAAVMEENPRRLPTWKRMLHNCFEYRHDGSTRLAAFGDRITAQSTYAQRALSLAESQRLIHEAYRAPTMSHEPLLRGTKLAKTHFRYWTTDPDVRAPDLVCPRCGSPLTYQQTFIGGVNRLCSERWDSAAMSGVPNSAPV